MTCDEVVNYLLAMDNGEPVAGKVAAHIERCAGCRREADRLLGACELLRSAPACAADEVLTVRIMASIRAEPAPVREPISLRYWVVGAAVMIGGVLALPFSEPLEWLRLSFGPVIDVAMGLILGLILTVYLCLLVGSNLRRVERLFRIR